jgi:nitroreductase
MSSADTATSELIAQRHVAADMLWVLETRRSVPPQQLDLPAPSPEQLRRILTIASRVPDHGSLVPWRFITVQGEARGRLGAAFADAYLRSDGAQPQEQAERTAARIRDAFSTPPVTVFVVSRADAAARFPEWEQTLSAGAACMNLIVAASALGFAANWLTGWVAYSASARKILGLTEQERIAGFIPIGTSRNAAPERPRPALDDIVTAWPADTGSSEHA